MKPAIRAWPRWPRAWKNGTSSSPTSITASKVKLRPHFYGPYHISAIVNDVAYLLELPPCTCLHDVFHMGLLKKFVSTPPASPPAPPPTSHGAAVLEPEHAARARHAREVCQILVQWKGELATSATWEDVDTFIDRYPSFQLEDELLVEGGGCLVGTPISA